MAALLHRWHGTCAVALCRKKLPTKRAAVDLVPGSHFYVPPFGYFHHSLAPLPLPKAVTTHAPVEWSLRIAAGIRNQQRIYSESSARLAGGAVTSCDGFCGCIYPIHDLYRCACCEGGQAGCALCLLYRAGARRQNA